MNGTRRSEGKYFVEGFTTAFNPMAIVWWVSPNGPRIRQIFLCGRRTPVAAAKSAYPGVRPQTCPEVAELAGRIRAFLSGGIVVFELDLAAMENCGEFQRQVLMAEYRIPRGRVTTYGRIANHIGAPGAARAVGTALATNPFPILIPCHRAVRADGGIGGYQGGSAMKHALLEMEGVVFIDEDRVSLEKVHYRNR